MLGIWIDPKTDKVIGFMDYDGDDLYYYAPSVTGAIERAFSTLLNHTDAVSRSHAKQILSFAFQLSGTETIVAVYDAFTRKRLQDSIVVGATVAATVSE